MKIDYIRKRLISHLEIHLKQLLPNHAIEEIYEYAVLPPGKLFRSLLVMALAQDNGIDDNELQNPWSNHSLMASFVEIHHAYTLVHDDLPCMDDDSMRRGRPSLHKRYGQWQAILVGDGLMGLGYHLLSFIQSPKQRELFRFVSWATGPKGLIHGQVLDLSGQAKQNFEIIKRTHTLKTARLIQVALLGSALLLKNGDNFFYRETFRMGHNLGLIFQFFDDFTELSSPLSSHEELVNPWLYYPDETLSEVQKYFKQVEQYCSGHPAVKEILSDYGKNIHSICHAGEKNIDQKIDSRYREAVLNFCKIWQNG